VKRGELHTLLFLFQFKSLQKGGFYTFLSVKRGAFYTLLNSFILQLLNLQFEFKKGKQTLAPPSGKNLKLAAPSGGRKWIRKIDSAALWRKKILQHPSSGRILQLTKN